MRMFDQSNRFFRVGNTISPSVNMQPDDVLKTKSALVQTGDYNVPYFGITEIPDMGMIKGLKTFQQKNGLKVDGVMKPNGPTEAKLGEAMVKQDVTNADLVEAAKPKVNVPKIDSLTGLPEGKMPAAKIWEKVAQQQKPKTAIIPKGETVQQRLVSMMQDKRYQDKQDTRLKDHVASQFKKAFPGQVSYDKTGKMNQPQAAIVPEDVEPFDPDGELRSRSKNISQKDPSEKPVQDEKGEKEDEGTDCVSLKQDMDNAFEDLQGANDDADRYLETLQNQVEVADKAWDDFVETLLDIGISSLQIPKKPHSDGDATNRDRGSKSQLFSFDIIERLAKKALKILDIAEYLSSSYDAYSTYSDELDALETFREDWLDALDIADELRTTYFDLKDKYRRECGK
ncbi:hypothetical protein [Terasakiella sp.]|uniref:hypothetical protein n=1 Tax=Terasakiella sp. TaxID=2034861 RepID=UPI003AA95807